MALDVEQAQETFPQLLLRHAKQHAELPALREKRRGIWRTLTWRNLADEVAALAGALSAHGLQRGAHVAVVGDNRPHLYAAMCAAQWLGAIVVPLYHDATAAELVAPLRSARATHVFAENQEQVDKLLEILPQCPTIRCIVYDDDRGMRHYKQPQLSSYAALLQQGRSLDASQRDAVQAEAARGTGQDAAFLFFTSGTTGPAKGVVLTHASLIDRARAAAAAAQLTETDSTIAYLPPAWIGQNFVSYAQPLVVGYCVCCPESSETLLADMREIGPTYFLASPRALKALYTQVTMRLEDAGSIIQRLYRHSVTLAKRVSTLSSSGGSVSVVQRLARAALDLLILGPLRDVMGMSKLKVAYAAGDAVDPDLLMFFRALGVNLKQLYGSTETGFCVAMQREGQVEVSTVGPAAHGVELKFTARREILVRSPGLFKEYHGDPESTARVRDAEGWFYTGDAGYLGADGHLCIIDRLENVGTLNDGTLIVPSRVESKLKVLPYIKEAVAFGDGRDNVCALVDIDAAAVAQWADKRTLSYAGRAELASLDDVVDLVAGCIGEVNAQLASDPSLARSQVHRFLIIHKELDADDGVLTRTGKLRREVVTQRFAPLVAALYEGRPSVRFDAGEGHEQNAESAVLGEVRIVDVKVFSVTRFEKVAAPAASITAVA